MKNKLDNTILAGLIAMNVLASPTVLASTTHLLIPEQSKVSWLGKKGVKVFGEHYGTVAVKDGKVTIGDDGQIKTAQIEIDMTQILNQDLSGDLRNTLLQHLNSADFFDTKKYPNAKFVSKKVTKLANNKYRIDGDMTIKGKTSPASITGEFSDKNGLLVFAGAFNFDRTKYGIQYGSGDFFSGLGDKMIHNLVTVDFEVKARK